MQDRQYLVVPGGHLWASEYHDAQGTKWTGIVGPKSSDLLWEYQAESGQDENGEPTSGFSGGPVVLADGTIIISTNAKQLIALNENGVVKWIADLPEYPVDTPALGPGGEIYVSDKQGGLSSFSPEGTLLWNFYPQVGREATSGPIVASNGMIYYTRVDAVQAVSVTGEPLWLTATSDTYLEEPPKLSAGEGYIFLGDGAMAAASGALLDLKELAVEELIFSSPTFFVGANGETYLRSGHGVIGWRITDSGVEVDRAITWDPGGTVLVNPFDQGVTPDDLTWLFYAGDYFDTHLVFLDKEGKVLSHVRPPDQQSKMIAIDKDLVAYICSNNFSIQANCQAMVLGEEQPSWVFELGDSVQIAGGALIEGRFYIATKTGLLYAIGDGSELGTVVSETQPAFSSKDQTPPTPTPTSAPTETALSIKGLSILSSSQAELGAALSFTATVTSGELVEFSWDFGDGESGEGAMVTHYYEEPGVYTATLNASNPVGWFSISMPVIISVPDRNVYIPAIYR